MESASGASLRPYAYGSGSSSETGGLTLVTQVWLCSSTVTFTEEMSADLAMVLGVSAAVERTAMPRAGEMVSGSNFAGGERTTN